VNYPDQLKYSVEHEWIDNDGKVGITEFAVEQIGDIVFVELPTVGTTVTAGKPFGVIESVKAVSELFAPASGTVTAVNESLTDSPEIVAQDCYGAGWLVKIEVSDAAEVGKLMMSAAYQDLIGK